MLRNCLKLSDMVFYGVMSLLPSFLLKDLPFGQVFLSIPQLFLPFVALTHLINPIVALRNLILCKSSLKLMKVLNSFELNVGKVLEKYDILLKITLSNSFYLLIAFRGIKYWSCWPYENKEVDLYTSSLFLNIYFYLFAL